MEQNHTWLQLFSEAASGEASADAGRTEAVSESAEAAPITWEQVKANPEFSQKMQDMVKNRLKDAKSAQENLEKLSPALRALSASYQLTDPSDYGALNQAILDDKRFSREDGIAGHFRGLQTQALALKARLPEFDLEKELENPAFVRLTAPNVGVCLEDAYYAIHRREAEEKQAAQIAKAIASGAMRPEENGTNAPAMTVFDYRNASAQQRQELKKKIRLAAARGEKVYPD